LLLIAIFAGIVLMAIPLYKYIRYLSLNRMLADILVRGNTLEDVKTSQAANKLLHFILEREYLTLLERERKNLPYCSGQELKFMFWHSLTYNKNHTADYVTFLSIITKELSRYSVYPDAFVRFLRRKNQSTQVSGFLDSILNIENKDWEAKHLHVYNDDECTGLLFKRNRLSHYYVWNKKGQMLARWTGSMRDIPGWSERQSAHPLDFYNVDRDIVPQLAFYESKIKELSEDYRDLRDPLRHLNTSLVLFNDTARSFVDYMQSDHYVVSQDEVREVYAEYIPKVLSSLATLVESIRYGKDPNVCIQIEKLRQSLPFHRATLENHMDTVSDVLVNNALVELDHVRQMIICKNRGGFDIW